MSISFDPMVTTGAADSFVLDTGGYVAGTFLDDPAMRYQLEGGFVASAQSTPLYGGIPVSLKVPTPAGSGNPVGPAIAAAADYAHIMGWTLFNQSAGMIITPSSNVPLASAGMSINFARPGSLLRIALPIDPTLVDSIVGGNENAQVSWDFTAQQIIAFSVTALPVAIEFISTNSKRVSISGSTYTWSVGAVAIVRI